MRIVHNKVDLETLDKVIDSKASRNDFQAQMEITSNLYSRLRLLSIMVVELARVMVPAKSSSSLKNTETINTKIQRRNYLFKQAQVACKWVTEFQNEWNEEALLQHDNQKRKRTISRGSNSLSPTRGSHYN